MLKLVENTRERFLAMTCEELIDFACNSDGVSDEAIVAAMSEIIDRVDKFSDQLEKAVASHRFKVVVNQEKKTKP